MDGWTTGLWLWLAAPLATAAVAASMRSPRAILNVACAGLMATVAGGVGVLLAWHGSPDRCIETPREWFRLDALSAYHLAILLIVHGLSTVYARIYFGAEIRDGRLPTRSARLFAVLWSASFVSMALVLLSNNLGIMWVSIEATTLVTAFLICVHTSRESLEAMWKYIVICSVGIAFAFLGEVLVASAARDAGLPEERMLLISALTAASSGLNPALMKVGFLLLLVGYGTKAGLAPMHNWLPDAHSQAPAPVSALFSGFMLSTALYCVVRHMPMVNGATGGVGWPQGLLTGFGLFSIVVAAGFILYQRDLKRFLAYSSVEHMGVIALGLGLGGLGTFAALFHTLNHSVCKTLAFFSAGRLGQIYGTNDMTRMGGAVGRAGAWGLGIFVSVVALIGVAPFSLFMSELQILLEGVSQGAMVTTVVFLVGLGVAFVGALAHAIAVAWGDSPGGDKVRSSALEWALFVAMGSALLALGLWMPGPLQSLLRQAVAVVQDLPAPSALVSGPSR
jgi:hydrogenase-4 component F